MLPLSFEGSGMTDDHLDVRLQLRVSSSEAAAIDTFRSAEGLASRAEAARLLLEIGLDTISRSGHRFWDRKPEEWSPNRK